MGKERLEQNLIDQMKEAQLKLGFEEETMRLYYPVASLNYWEQIVRQRRKW